MRILRLAARVLVLLPLLAWLTPSAAAPAPQPFQADSLQRIVQIRQGKPFLLVLWSLDCSVCMKELDTWSGLLKKQPKLNLVLISTDAPELAGEAAAVLEMRGLGAAESWIFAEGDSPELRYAVDPSWYGELPRSYFYEANGQRRAVSGAIEEAELNRWATDQK
ncbi:MAG TPA: hypothetical protein VI457_14210 [Methylococcaceae bacterium]|nr:hypothetical protein [Methylococcaceae bacterium]